MHTEVFKNIDILTEMAGSSIKNMDEVNTELISLKRQIRNKSNEVEDFKAMLTDARYFNASNELVDKNIEISLKNKIARLKRKIKELNGQADELNSSEDILHKEIVGIKEKIVKDEEYKEVLATKLDNDSDNTYYNNMLLVEENNLKELNSILDSKTLEYNNILKEIELNNQANYELKTKLDREELRLDDVLDNLTNPNTYIDEDLKANDEAKLASLEEELKALEKRELELLTNASVIGADAKELVATNDINGALAKIKELVTIVKEVPFMDITNTSILDEELEKKENVRVQLANLIDSKNYEGINSEALKERTSYLNNEIKNNEELIAKIKNEIANIDEVIKNELGKKISDLETEIINAEKVVLDYKGLLKMKDNASKSKVSLEQAINKRQEEIQVLDRILKSYKEDLIAKINETNKLGERIKRLETVNEKHKKELEELEKMSLINFKAKDLMEEEKDKEDLRKINEEIKQIKNRKKFDKSPNEIYDLIEMSLASEKIEEKVEETSLEKESEEDVYTGIINPTHINTVDIERPKIEEVITDSIVEVDTNEEKDDHKNWIKVTQMIPVETVKKKEGNV